MSAVTGFPRATSGSRAASGARVKLADRAALSVLVVVATALRLIHIGSQSYWGDEDATVRLMRQSLWHMFRYGIVTTEATPPLYYVIAAFWSRIFGTGEFALRSLSALVGVATVVVAYAIGVELRSRRGGLILAAFVSLSPLMVWYSQDARAYSLLIFLTSLALLFFAQALRTESSKSIWLWAFAAAAALTTHYFAIFVIAPEAVALLVFRKTRSRAIRPTILVAAIWIALLPLFLDQQSKTGHTSWITYIGLTTRLKIALQWFVTGRWDYNFPLIIAAGLCVAIVGGIGLAARRLHERELVILGVGASGLVLPVVMALVGLDYVIDRYLVAIWIPFAVVLAATLASWKKVGYVLAVPLCGLALAATLKTAVTPSLERSGWRQAAQELSVLPPHTLDIVYPDFEVNALKVYAPDLSVVTTRTVRTRRIVIVAQDPWSSTRANTLAFHLPSAFRETGETPFSTFELITYSARHAVPVAVNRLTSMRPTGYLTATTPWASSVFYDPSAASSR
jgi:mannosyltransferase